MNIFYYMHIDWGWIKQRPQFIAEGLSRYFNVCVYHERSYRNHRLCERSQISQLYVKSLPHLPFMRYNLIFKINMWLLNRIVLLRKYQNAEFVWFTHPMHFSSFICNNQIIIYDCMDDILEFNYPNSVKKRYYFLEKQLCNKADYIITSSDYLKKKLLNRYGIKKNISVVNNAISLTLHDDVELPNHILHYFENKTCEKIVTYLGTISSWFDFDLLVRTLEVNSNVEFLLFGPKEVEIPKNSRIKYGNIIEHKYISKIMQLSDALIMPFKVNELIQSVNPVKAYEYIYAYKPIFMPQYDESLKFVDYIYLYNNSDTFISWISDFTQGKLKAKKTKTDCHKFALNNNWNNRITQILSILPKNEL